MSSAPRLCGPQISCFRPGLTTLQSSILLLAPTLGLALQDAFGRSVLNIETGTPQGAVEGMSGGQLRRSARSSYSVSYCWPWETLSHHHIPMPVPMPSLSLSLALFYSISFPTYTQTGPIKQRVWKPSFLCVAVLKVKTIKLQDYNTTIFRHRADWGLVLFWEHVLFLRVRAGKIALTCCSFSFLRVVVLEKANGDRTGNKHSLWAPLWLYHSGYFWHGE